MNIFELPSLLQFVDHTSCSRVVDTCVFKLEDLPAERADGGNFGALQHKPHHFVILGTPLDSSLAAYDSAAESRLNHHGVFQCSEFPFNGCPVKSDFTAHSRKQFLSLPASRLFLACWNVNHWVAKFRGCGRNGSDVVPGANSPKCSANSEKRHLAR